jgi:YidC/Oxa1 family membrane protein insertase
MQLSGDKVDEILKRFEDHELFSVDFEPHVYETYAKADVMVTAWSGAAFEFAFAFRKPVISIDVPKKIMNPNYRLIENEPLEVGVRDEIGVVLKPSELGAIADSVDRLVKDRDRWASRLESVAAETVFNLGRAAVVGADYLESIMFVKDSNR